MTERKARRYREVGVAPRAEGFSVVLDGQPLLSPRGTVVVVPTAPLAFAIAAEWAGQGDRIRPESLVLTRLANSVIDYVQAARPAVVEHLAGYVATDLLCYRAIEPPDLVIRQSEAWQPILDWLADTHGAHLVTTAGIIPVSQSATAVQAIRDHLGKTTDWDLGGIAVLIQTTGSVALGLAAGARRLDGETAWRLSQLDEAFQNERWGEDTEAMERRQGIRSDIDSAVRFLALCRD